MTSPNAQTPAPLSREEADRRIRRAANAGAWFCSIVAALCVVGFVYSCVVLVFSVRAGMEHYDVDPLTAVFITDAKSGTYTFDSDEHGSALSVGARPVKVIASDLCADALTFAMFFMAKRLCQEISRSGRVFDPVHARELGRIGIVGVLCGFVPGLLLLLGDVVAVAWVRALNEGAFAFSISYNMVGETGLVLLDFGDAAVGVLLVLVAKVVEYGCILQQQDDELL